MHRSYRKFSPENVQLALTKLRLLGKEIPMFYSKDTNGDFGHWPYHEADVEMQKRYWVKLMHYASGKLARW